MRFSHSVLRVLAIVLLMAAWLVIPGCGGGGGGGGTGPAPTSSTGGGGGGATNPLSPAAAPGAPGSIPPPVVGPSRVGAEAAGDSAVTYNFPAGWSMVSFPLASVTSASGFTYQLYSYQGTGYVLVDPVASPGQLDTTRAYWAYFDAPATVTVNGPANTGAVTTVRLQSGWNLLGCPSTAQLPTRNMTVTRQAGATKVVEEAANSALNAGSAWIYQYLWVLSGSGSYVTHDLTGLTAALQPKGGHWLFAWTDADLNLNVAPPSPVPTISSLSTTTLAAGSTVDINGSGFGDAAAGLVVVNGVSIPTANIQSWSASLVRFTVPTGLTAGKLVVLVNRYPSNRVAVTVSGSGGGGTTGSLSGKVQSSSGGALAGAQILIDTGHSATSDGNGNFQIDGIPAGDHLVYVTLIGYQTAVGQVSVTAGATRSVLVELTPAGGGGGGGGETQGNLHVRAYPYSSGGTRFWAYRIEITERGNYSERWSNTWYSDYGDTYNQLTADGAIVGRTYNVKVTWRNASGEEHSNTWWVTLDSTSQTETYYSW